MLTQRQQEAQRFIEDFVRQNDGTSPSVREISSALGYKSSASAWRLMQGLRRRGFLRVIPGHRRSIEVLRHLTEDRRDTVINAARELIKNLISENPENGYAIVRAADLGDLDVALAELDAAK